MLKVVKQNENLDIMGMLEQTGAIMKGHFKLTSGYHSQHYLQCAQLLKHPDLTSQLAVETKNVLARSINTDNLDLIVSPAIGGIFYGYMIAYSLGIDMIFTERKSDKMELRRGFDIEKGQKIVVAEDVVTTGGSVKEVIEICKKMRAEVMAVVSIVDRSQNIDFGLPYQSLITLDIEKYSPQDCPLCQTGVKIDVPGSRK